MNIAIVRRWDASKIDGVNRFIFTLADGFERLGHEVVIFCHHAENPNDLPSIFGVNAEVRTVGSVCRSLIKCMWDWYVHGSRTLNEFKPDIVIVNGVVPLRLKVFKVAVNHGNAMFELRESRLKRYVTKLLYST